MDITSLEFLIFLGITLILYYLLPQKAKWILLLLASLCFVASYDYRGIIFLLATTFSIWFAAKRIAKKIQQNPDVRKGLGKGVMLAALFFNIGILALLKYIFPAVQGFLKAPRIFQILIPLGLSYYTLQAVSYVLDVYWQKIPAERSYFKLLLYVCYFPQMLQGPISRYSELSHELYEKDHRFEIRNVKHGVQLMLWGCFKTMVIGDRAGILVNNAFHSGNMAYGLAAFAGLAIFGVQLYCNFSGGIDIVRGASQCFGVILPDNFRQPFFSASLGEFWRRWHITLGTWMKDYVFYPLSMSRPVSRFKKSAKKHISRKWANRIPIAFANLVVFLLVGIWHGFGTNYALWGLYNGIILAFSALMTDAYKASKQKLHISDDSKAWHCFSIIRTFFIITAGWCTDCADSAAGSLQILKNMLFISQTNLSILGGTFFNYLILFTGIVIILIVSLFSEKGKSVLDMLDKRSTFVQMVFWIAVIQVIALLWVSDFRGGFMYADF
ncbi:MAG: MBOAT family O-acyltransferase [Candidatus Limivicinus sp.]|jgi:alginate O-acetyltransferase complex protein AlgI